MRRLLHRLGLSLIKRASGGGADMRRNGERWLMGRVGPEARRVLDVGYNHGRYSAALLEVAPHLRILAVEPVTEFYEAGRAAAPEAVDLVNVALSDAPGEIALYRKGGGASASPTPPKSKTFAALTLRAVTGDALLAERGFEPVDFVKVDTDGHDMAVLRGLSRTIETARPVVQFEFGRFWLDTRAQLRDAFLFFEERDYRVGYLTRRGVWFVRPHVRHEIYGFSANMVAAPADRADALAL